MSIDTLERSVLAVVDEAYSAATGTGTWNDVVARIGAIVGGGSISLNAHRIQGGLVACDLLVEHGMDDAARRSYVDHYAALNPLIPSLAHATPGVVRHVGDLMDRDVFRRSAYAADFLHGLGLGEVGGILLDNDGGRSAALSVYFARDVGDHTRFEGLFRLIEPHLRRALRTNELLAAGRSAAAALAATLDRTDKPILLVDADRRLLHATPPAEAILSLGDGLTVRDHRLVARAPHVDRDLAASIARATTPADPLAGPDDGDTIPVIVVPRPSRRAALRVTVLPLPAAERLGVFDVAPHALVVVRDPEARRSVPPAPLLARWFGLTVAEAELAAALMAGASPAAHAAGRGVSHETVRTQLKSLMGKLGCHRQAELVAVLHDQGPPHAGI